MKHLSTLTPAETLMVLQDKRPSLSELIDITFKDLLLKKIIRVYEAKKQGHRAGTFYIYKFVKKGEKFFLFSPMEHELIFKKVFETDHGDTFMLKQFSGELHKKAESKEKYYSSIIQSPNISMCFKKGAMQKIFGGHTDTDQKKTMRTEIEQEISELEKRLPTLIVNDQAQVREIIERIKGNIYLLTCIGAEEKKLLDLDYHL